MSDKTHQVDSKRNAIKSMKSGICSARDESFWVEIETNKLQVAETFGEKQYAP